MGLWRRDSTIDGNNLPIGVYCCVLQREDTLISRYGANVGTSESAQASRRRSFGQAHSVLRYNCASFLTVESEEHSGKEDM